MQKLNLQIIIFLFVFLQIFAVHHQYLHQSEVNINGSYFLEKNTKNLPQKTIDHECLLCNFINDFRSFALTLFSLQILFLWRVFFKRYYQNNYTNQHLFLKKFSQAPPTNLYN